MTARDRVVQAGRPPSSETVPRPIGVPLRFDRSGDAVAVYIVQGGSVVVEYEPARLPGCCTRYDGMPVWDLSAFVRFDPPRPVPFAAQVSLDAESVKLWFATRSLTEAWPETASGRPTGLR
jgi:Family of unknown function (DUF6209)